MLYTHVGELPHHIDCWVDDGAVLREPEGRTLPCRWFGLTSHPGRMWGCSVLLENGAVYRDIPPYRLALDPEPDPRVLWGAASAQTWDCYGWEFATIRYSALADLRVTAAVGEDRQDYRGRYLFSAAPVGDGFSADPSQDKEFAFVHLDIGRLTIQPTDRVLFHDRSFTTHKGLWPSGLRRSDTVHRCE